MTRKVLMISPHFPPDTSAASHRVRLLAPHLSGYGWTPTVLTLTDDSYEGRLDPDLSRLVPENLRVERCRALPATLARSAGVGDLGIRSFMAIRRAARKLLSSEKYSALFITIYPTYPALLGGPLKREFGIPFVLDYQDPWVGAWGLTVGGGPNSSPDLRSRLSRRVALLLEPRAVNSADGITAVSSLTYENLAPRIPRAASIPSEVIPLGGEASDFEYLRRHPRPNAYFEPGDGNFHVCYTGALLPLGIQTLRAFLSSVKALRARRPDAYARLRIHFFGTSNQTTGALQPRVMPHAIELGVGDVVTEHPARIDYLDALTVQTQASALLLLGSSESHYTASKLYPALLSHRPVIAAYHNASSVSAILRQIAHPDIRLVTYDELNPVAECVEPLMDHLISLMDGPPSTRGQLPPPSDEDWSARAMAGRLARLMDRLA